MMQLEMLWKERAGAFWNIALRYFRLIGNSSFLFTLVLTLIFGAYYYSELLKVLPETFPGVAVITIIAAFVIVRTPLRFFLSEADLVFLLPAESKLKDYFLRSLFYSFMLQAFITVVTMVILAPLYQHEMAAGTSYYIFVIAIMLLLKGLNVLMKWMELHLPAHRSVVGFVVVRTFMTMLLSYLLFVQASWVFVSLTAIGFVGVLLFVFFPLQGKYAIKWEKLLALDEKQSMKFYRTANLFTDVPKLKQSVKGRRVISSIADKILPNDTVYEKLYQKAFVRSNEYLGIYLRLLLIGLLVIVFVPGTTGKMIGAGLFIYLTATQLRTLYPHFDAHVMIKLYPLKSGQKDLAFQKMLKRLLGVQAVLFALIALVLTQSVITFFLIGLIGSVAVLVATMKKTSKP
ncbi:ABC transporter permease [Guptibacillus algicola]|uniref:ABC transporter permease n=1 Tax=Guptibacillus algicola TaxID=225844 RepID=UPI001CD62F8A|nr:ABC transporter permease [Alkalihalobacillus algicola]MCA0989178.1 ABC transporter permease [Alkalihalobacillus algicola]